MKKLTEYFINEFNKEIKNAWEDIIIYGSSVCKIYINDEQLIFKRINMNKDDYDNIDFDFGLDNDSHEYESTFKSCINCVNWGSLGCDDYDSFEDCPGYDRRSFKKVETTECEHVWKFYQGLNEQYYYCEKCDKKRN